MKHSMKKVENNSDKGFKNNKTYKKSDPIKKSKRNYQRFQYRRKSERSC